MSNAWKFTALISILGLLILWSTPMEAVLQVTLTCWVALGLFITGYIDIWWRR